MHYYFDMFSAAIICPVYIIEALESLFQNIPNLYSSNYDYPINSWFFASIPKTAVYSKTKGKLTFVQKTFWNRVCFVVLSLRLKFYENLTTRKKTKFEPFFIRKLENTCIWSKKWYIMNTKFFLCPDVSPHIVNDVRRF